MVYCCARLPSPAVRLSADTVLPRLSPDRPANLPGQTVTVQSKQEVEARKALRKEEKRMQRDRGRQTAAGQDAETPAIQPELARAQR